MVPFSGLRNWPLHYLCSATGKAQYNQPPNVYFMKGINIHLFNHLPTHDTLWYGHIHTPQPHSLVLINFAPSNLSASTFQPTALAPTNPFLTNDLSAANFHHAQTLLLTHCSKQAYFDFTSKKHYDEIWAFSLVIYIYFSGPPPFSTPRKVISNDTTKLRWNYNFACVGPNSPL